MRKFVVYDTNISPYMRDKFDGVLLNNEGLLLDCFFYSSLLFCFRYDLSLSLEESISGGQREINIPCFETCDRCNGSGANSSKSIKTCSECDGRGRMMKTQRTPFGVVSQVRVSF